MRAADDAFKYIGKCLQRLNDGNLGDPMVQPMIILTEFMDVLLFESTDASILVDKMKQVSEAHRMTDRVLKQSLSTLRRAILAVILSTLDCVSNIRQSKRLIVGEETFQLLLEQDWPPLVPQALHEDMTEDLFAPNDSLYHVMFTMRVMVGALVNERTTKKEALQWLSDVKNAAGSAKSEYDKKRNCNIIRLFIDMVGSVVSGLSAMINDGKLVCGCYEEEEKNEGDEKEEERNEEEVEIIGIVTAPATPLITPKATPRPAQRPVSSTSHIPRSTNIPSSSQHSVSTLTSSTSPSMVAIASRPSNRAITSSSTIKMPRLSQGMSRSSSLTSSVMPSHRTSLPSSTTTRPTLTTTTVAASSPLLPRMPSKMATIGAQKTATVASGSPPLPGRSLSQKEYARKAATKKRQERDDSYECELAMSATKATRASTRQKKNKEIFDPSSPPRPSPSISPACSSSSSDSANSIDVPPPPTLKMMPRRPSAPEGLTVPAKLVKTDVISGVDKTSMPKLIHSSLTSQVDAKEMPKLVQTAGLKTVPKLVQPSLVSLAIPKAPVKLVLTALTTGPKVPAKPATPQVPTSLADVFRSTKPSLNALKPAVFTLAQPVNPAQTSQYIRPQPTAAGHYLSKKFLTKPQQDTVFTLPPEIRTKAALQHSTFSTRAPKRSIEQISKASPLITPPAPALPAFTVVPEERERSPYSPPPDLTKDSCYAEQAAPAPKCARLAPEDRAAQRKIFAVEVAKKWDLRMRKEARVVINETKEVADRELKCTHCKFSTTNASIFLKHLSIVHNTTVLEQSQMLRCRCGFIVSDEKRLKAHVVEFCERFEHEREEVHKEEEVEKRRCSEDSWTLFDVRPSFAKLFT